MDDTVMIEARGVSKKFCKQLHRSLWYGVQDIAAELAPWRANGHPTLRPQEFWGLHDVSFQLKRGEACAILGPNGAGKSTLLKLLNGLIKPDGGEIALRGRVGALIELGAGFSPILTGRENIYINAAVLGLTRRQTDDLVEAIIEFAELREFIDTPIKNYSSGMYVRLGYAVAAHLHPDILLVDEVLAVGDLAFRRKCFQHMHHFTQNGGTLILVSHNLFMLQSLCTTGLLFERGEIARASSTVETVNLYLEHQAQYATRQPQQRARANEALAVAISNVQIEPVDSTELESGKGARIMLHYHAAQAYEHVDWAISLWTADLTVCIAYGSAEAWNGNLAPGDGTLVCRLPKLPLNPGMYALRASIHDSAQITLALYGYQNPPTYFTIRSNPHRTENILLMTGALIPLDIEWQTT